MVEKEFRGNYRHPGNRLKEIICWILSSLLKNNQRDIGRLEYWNNGKTIIYV